MTGDVLARLNAAPTRRDRVERELGEGGMATGDQGGREPTAPAHPAGYFDPDRAVSIACAAHAMDASSGQRTITRTQSSAR